MRTTLMILAAGTAALAAPALAQVDVGGVAQGTVGADVGVNPGDTVTNTVDQVTQPVGDTVDSVNDAVNETVDATELTLATREQVRAGAQVTDSEGNSVGTVQSVDGDQAIVVDGGKLYNVPLSSLYSHAGNAAHGLVTKLPRSEIKARATGSAEAEAEAETEAR